MTDSSRAGGAHLMQDTKLAPYWWDEVPRPNLPH